jgi:hypothetical protein
MANIDLEPKRRGSSAWGWIIAAIIVLIILWAIFGHRAPRARTTDAGALAAAHVQPPAWGSHGLRYGPGDVPPLHRVTPRSSAA